MILPVKPGRNEPFPLRMYEHCHGAAGAAPAPAVGADAGAALASAAVELRVGRIVAAAASAQSLLDRPLSPSTATTIRAVMPCKDTR